MVSNTSQENVSAVRLQAVLRLLAQQLARDRVRLNLNRSTQKCWFAEYSALKTKLRRAFILFKLVAELGAAEPLFKGVNLRPTFEMKYQFKKIGPVSARGDDQFTVGINSLGNVFYQDDRFDVDFPAERLLNNGVNFCPEHIQIARGWDEFDRNAEKEIVERITLGLQFVNILVEVVHLRSDLGSPITTGRISRTR